MPAHPALRLMAPLDGLAVAEVLLEALEGLFEPRDVVDEAAELDGLADPEDVAPKDAVDSPAISAETDAEKVPVILSRLFTLKI